MRAKRLAPTEFRIVPSEPGKAVRIVRFHLDEDSGEAFIECFDEVTKAACGANAHARTCSHVEKAIKLLLKKGRKET